MSKSIVKTIIVDDHLLFAEGLARILHDLNHIELIGTVHSYAELSELMSQQAVDLILLDIQLKNENGIEICADVKERFPLIKVILISMYDPGTLATEIRKCNPDGYIPKSTDAEAVKDAISNVLNGENVFLEIGSNSYTEQPYFKIISSREKEIIALIKQGLSARQISEELNISQFTVNTHRKNILRKLKLNSVKDLIAFSFNNNL